MQILALDLSTKSSGWAIYDQRNLTKYGCITNSSTTLMKRIHYMVEEIDKILQENAIEKIYVEEVRPEDKGVGANIKTYKALMYLQGAIEMLIYLKHPKINIVYVYPSEWRKSCGIHTGRGIKREELKKADIQFAKNIFGIEVNDDTADAIGIGYHAAQENNKNYLF